MNKLVLYNSISIVSCFTIITTLSLYGRPYVNMETLFNSLGNTNYKLFYGIIGANVATITNEITNEIMN